MRPKSCLRLLYEIGVLQFCLVLLLTARETAFEPPGSGAPTGTASGGSRAMLHRHPLALSTLEILAIDKNKGAILESFTGPLFPS